MRVRDEQGLTFDDVLLVPRRSSVASRTAVDTSSRLTRRLKLCLPIVSANMDTVTESAMAIAMAQLGGLGIIHRFMTGERQAREVSRVKRAEGYIVEEPATIQPTATVGAAREVMATSGIGGLLVVDAVGTLLGIVTTRDVLFAPDPLAPVQSVMAPRERLVTAPAGIDLDTARARLHEHRVEKLPLLDGDGRVAGLITATSLDRRTGT